MSVSQSQIETQNQTQKQIQKQKQKKKKYSDDLIYDNDVYKKVSENNYYFWAWMFVFLAVYLHLWIIVYVSKLKQIVWIIFYLWSLWSHCIT